MTFVEKGDWLYDIEVKGIIVGGFSLVMPEEDDSDQRPYLERIDIDEQFRGKGYGTEALYQIKDIFGSFYLAPDNEDSKRLFERIMDEDTSENAWAVDQGFGVYEM